MEGRNGEETGTAESWRSRREEPRKKGPKDSLQNSHLCPGTASPPTLTLSVNVVFVCLSSNPEEQLTGGEWDVFISGPPSPSAVVNMCSLPPWAPDTSHGPFVRKVCSQGPTRQFRCFCCHMTDITLPTPPPPLPAVMNFTLTGSERAGLQ